MKVISIRLDDEFINKIDEISKKTLMSRSEVIRSALAVYISLLENIGFYFKPTHPIKNIDVYEERNAVNLDLGNLTSVTVFSVTYGGVGEKKFDYFRKLEFVAEVMANQLIVESICRFVKPLVVMVSTINDFRYSIKFLKNLKNAIQKREKVKVILSSVENFFETNQSGFSCTLVGIRDMSVRNSPQRGDKIFFYGRSVNSSELRPEDLLEISKVKELADLVRKGIATSIFPVKSGGVSEVAEYIAALSGGRAYYENLEGCPATAVVLTSEKNLTKFGCLEIGEIL